MKLRYSGSYVHVTLEDEEDLYSLFRFLKPGDVVGSRTSRRLKQDDGGSRVGRQQVYIEVRVEKVSFYGFSESLRISGKIVHSSESSISLDTYHSLKVGLHHQLSIHADGRSSSDFDVLVDRVVGDDTGRVVVLIDDDEVYVYKVGSRATKLLLELVPGIPRKSSDSVQYERGLIDFFDDILSFLLDFSRESNIDSLIVAGPGFTKDSFYDFLKSRSVKLSKLVTLVDVKSMGRRGLLEVLRNHLPDIPAGVEASLVETALENLSLGNDKTLYGFSEIERVATTGAIESLLVLDEKLYESLEIREALDNLSSQVRSYGGKVYLLSSLHPSVDQIRGLGGLIALLRYPVSF